VTSLEQRCRETLEGSWIVSERDGVPFAYTRPSPGRYRWQWYWDSCFAAIAWRHFDPARSRAELETLLAAARPDGFIGHTIFWEHPVSGPRELFYNVIHREDAMTATIQPPALAFAWSMAVGDPKLEPRIAAHHAEVSAERDLEGDGLLWILQPDESGLDASPQFDPIWRHEAQGLPGFVELVRRNRKREFRIEAVRAAGDPVVCEVMTNVINGLSRLALGLPSITPALIARLIHARLTPGFAVVVMAYIIGALGGSIPLPASAGTVGGMGGMLILYKVDHNAAIAAVLLHQAIGLLVPLAGGGVAYAILRRRFGPVMRRASNGGPSRPVR
jgi:hypothetical protein